jgi:hypothetical protein
MSAQRNASRASKRSPKKPTVADLLAARIAREQRLVPKTTTAPVVTERLIHIGIAAERLGVSVWTLRHWACEARLNYRRVGRRIFVTESEIARLAGPVVTAVNAA